MDIPESACFLNWYFNPVLSISFFLIIQPIFGVKVKSLKFCSNPINPAHSSKGVVFVLSPPDNSIYFKSTFTISSGKLLLLKIIDQYISYIDEERLYSLYHY